MSPGLRTAKVAEMGSSHTPPESPPRAWAEVCLDRMRDNARSIAAVAGCPLMVVVKAGAYGHGLEETARALSTIPETAFSGVANVGEARRIAESGVNTPIYLLGATWAGEREEVVARGWIPCLSSLEEAQDFERLAAARRCRLTAHLAIDTGMGRGGFPMDQIPGLMDRLERMEHLKIDGIGSHFSSADEDSETTQRQIALFREALAMLGGAERFRWRHLPNSAGLSGYRDDSWNLVRPGLLLYGASPLPGKGPKVLPTMHLFSRVTLIRTLPAGHGISYGRTYVTERETRVATVGIGYGDGLPRSLSGQGAEVFVRGQRAPVLGRITMDQLMVDITALPEVREGDPVELFGDHIPVTEVAARAGTIPWEILTRITPRVTRFHSSRNVETSNPNARADL